MTEIFIPARYPGDDEYIALVTRMRIAGAWDPQNDWLVRMNDPEFNSGRYAQFINDCVGSESASIFPPKGGKFRVWTQCISLRERGFTSMKTNHAYVVRKL